MLKKYFAEFTGTFLIVFVGCGSIVLNQEYKGIVSHFGISLLFGAIVYACIYVFKNYSTHFNPAVSITLYAQRLLSLKHLLFFVFFQCLGAITSAALLHLLFPLNDLLGSTIPTGGNWQSFLLEFILTLLLLALIFKLDKHPTKYAGVLIGLLIFLGAYFAGPICGASMNPARSIGPALISGHTEYLWIYLLAPVFGGLTALLITKK